jgi:D-alanyl-lipoteichoic acid acyltransferase DltB (MBOAT superfamily)
MLFTSFEFILFFIVILAIFWGVNAKYRWIILLVASYYFYYTCEPSYVLLILLSTAIDYLLCNFLTSSNRQKRKITGLALSVIMNLSLLFFFKYFNFFQEALADILNALGSSYKPQRHNLLLPIGISFYTFQTMSYSFDVYRGKTQVERHFGKFALYVSFFPQLVAGPIERANDLLPQFSKQQQLSASMLRDGATLFLWGLFKKIVVADNLKVLVDHVFENPQFQNGGAVLFALFAFTIQIYADFSGYSDMAIGLARMMGIHLNINFRTPYFAQSFTAFWNRWHITFSTWLKDYFFKPLGGMKRGSHRLKVYIILFITFVFAGLWHGASWNFLIWGSISGVMVIVERITGWRKNAKNRYLGWIKTGITFSLLVMTAIFFRSIDVNQSQEMIAHLSKISFSEAYIAFADNLISPGVLGLITLFLVDAFIAQKTILDLHQKPILLQYTWAILILIMIFFLGDTASQDFLYFRF